MSKPQSFLVECVQSGDIEKIHDALSTYLTKNPSNDNNEISNAIKYIEQNFARSIWEEHDERALEMEQMKWNKEYLARLKADLRHNFSKKRFNHILEVGKVVYPAKKKLPSQESTVRKKPQNRTVSINPLWIIAGSAIIGALILVYLNKGK